MRLAARLAPLAPSVFLASCLASPALEPLGGFELAAAPAPEAWRELDPRELERMLAEARARLAPIADYRAVLETRERIGDELFPRRVLRLALRHSPFGVALETDAPPAEKGERAWFDGSADEPELVAETPGFFGRLVGRVSLDPEGDLALRNRRHPITDIGLLRLAEQIEQGFEPALTRDPPECALGYRSGFDAQSGLLVYFGVAELRDDGPALIEEYLYHDLVVNVGFTDSDFRPPE